MVEEDSSQSLQVFMDKMALQKIKRLLQETVGLNCDGYRDEYLKRRFEIRLRTTGAKTYGNYLVYLRKNPDEFTNLLNDLTVNFTMFFRDADVYQYLGRELLPKLLQSSGYVRIWSAGCATGEEPYSLAILVHRALREAIGSHLVTIYASDVDKDALSKAAKGQYQQKQLCDVDSAIIDEYFVKEGEYYNIKDFIKRMVHFQSFDLMAPPLHHNMDLILCRNVMIYFSKESQEHIHMNFYNALRDSGYLVTGKSEMLSGQPAKKFVPVDCQVRVYQKPNQTNETLKFSNLTTCSKTNICPC